MAEILHVLFLQQRSFGVPGKPPTLLILLQVGLWPEPSLLRGMLPPGGTASSRALGRGTRPRSQST